MGEVEQYGRSVTETCFDYLAEHERFLKAAETWDLTIYPARYVNVDWEAEEMKKICPRCAAMWGNPQHEMEALEDERAMRCVVCKVKLTQMEYDKETQALKKEEHPPICYMSGDKRPKVKMQAGGTGSENKTSGATDPSSEPASSDGGSDDKQAGTTVPLPGGGKLHKLGTQIWLLDDFGGALELLPSDPMYDIANKTLDNLAMLSDRATGRDVVVLSYVDEVGNCPDEFTRKPEHLENPYIEWGDPFVIGNETDFGAPLTEEKFMEACGQLAPYGNAWENPWYDETRRGELYTPCTIGCDGWTYYMGTTGAITIYNEYDQDVGTVYPGEPEWADCIKVMEEESGETLH
jgi:hypothetical protein